jgi:Alpha/beta hydrolase family
MTNHIVLVHGAWHNSEGFAPLRSELESVGITSSTVSLASAAPADAPIGDLYGDAELVRNHVDALGQDCFVLAHSYGGLPVTQGLTGTQSVKGLVFLTAFVLDQNETLFQACGAQDPPWWVRSADNERLTTSTPEQVFYNTCSNDVASEAVSNLRTQSVLSFNQPITQVAWKEIPSTYILCEHDNAIPFVAQEAMSARTNQTLTMSTDHSPFLSAPKDLALILSEVMK